MSKQQLANEEQKQGQLEQRRNSLQQEIAKASETLLQHRAAEQRKQAELNETHSAVITLREDNARTRCSIAKLRKDVDNVREELASCECTLSTEKIASADTKAAKTKMDEVIEGLRAVHEELHLLSSEAAKKAACKAAGADLPSDIVPAAVPEVEVTDDLQALWLLAVADSSVCSCGVEFAANATCCHKCGSSLPTQVPAVLRDALQSHAVLATLQRSLTVRAGELREGLRQWGFAQSATKRTDELCISLKASLKSSEVEASHAQVQKQQLKIDTESNSASLAALRMERVRLDERHIAVLAELTAANAQITDFERQCEGIQIELAEVTRLHGRLEQECEELDSQLQQQYAVQSQHSEEASRRVNAAEQLVRRSREQAQRAAAELEQTKHELASFHQAYSVLKEARLVMISELEEQRRGNDQLQDAHDELNMELSSLAQHYMDILPGGFERYSQSLPGSPVTNHNNILMDRVS